VLESTCQDLSAATDSFMPSVQLQYMKKSVRANQVLLLPLRPCSCKTLNQGLLLQDTGPHWITSDKHRCVWNESLTDQKAR
jgi:hypothetical protein